MSNVQWQMYNQWGLFSVITPGWKKVKQLSSYNLLMNTLKIFDEATKILKFKLMTRNSIVVKYIFIWQIQEFKSYMYIIYNF